MSTTEVKALRQIADHGPICNGADVIGVKNGRVSLRTFRMQGLIELDHEGCWIATEFGKYVLKLEIAKQTTTA